MSRRKKKPPLKWELYKGKWDSYGFGLSYCHYEQAFMIEFIHWYIGFSVYREKD